ncbi:MAG: efflux RND transporter periplasmic adaptor subunit [Flavobacteriaceae bacterium]|nr:efflux RND transporter periplasmic adaptor subunit [Flavobacteriaceae bacterium]
MKYSILLFAMLFISCNSNENIKPVTKSDSIPSKSLTLWTNKTELFVEFPALVVNQSSRFAAHFTVLKGHQPVKNGAVTVSLIKNGKGIRNTVQSPSSPGIFSPTLQPKEAGNYQLVFDITTPNFSDKVIIHDIIVYPSIEDAINALGNDAANGGISFLKEQAWKIDFQTEPVTKGEIFNIINTSGVWKPSLGSTKSLISKSNGIVNFSIKNNTEGSTVKKGQLLLNISSKGLTKNNLDIDLAKAKATYQQVKLDYKRKKDLFDSKIVSKSEFEKVERNFLIAKSIYENLSIGVSTQGMQIRAPFDGYIKTINVSNGEYVEQGTVLMLLGAKQTTLLEAKISPSYGLTLDNIQKIGYKSNTGNWIDINETGGNILSIEKDVTYNKPLISVFTQVNNNVNRVNGSITEMQIAFGNTNKSVTIPVNTLLEDYGRFSVVVQISGESFERRPVKIGRRNGENVEILQGLEVGEVVVTQGAYQVKMASMSGSTPAHGHEH